jgi:hypothetical protein
MEAIFEAAARCAFITFSPSCDHAPLRAGFGIVIWLLIVLPKQVGGTNLMRSCFILILLTGASCATSKPAAIKLTSTKATDDGQKKTTKKKKKKRTERFERQCVSGQIPGCETTGKRRLLDERVKREVSDHLELYRPLVRRLKRLIEEPGRSPDARIEGDVELAEGERNHEGPHAITLDVDVRYPRGLKRHPKAKEIRKVFRQIDAINDLLTAANAYHRISVEEIKEALVDLKLHGKGSKNRIEVQIPSEDRELVLSAQPATGTIVSSVVTTEPGLQYRAVHEWIRPLKPSLVVGEAGTGVLVSEVPAADINLQFARTIDGLELCDTLRGEIRILFAGAPRQRWAVDALEESEDEP